MASANADTDASSSINLSSTLAVNPSAHHVVLVNALDYHHDAMAKSRLVLDQHLDNFVLSSADPAVKKEHEEKAAHLLAASERYEANYRRAKAMVDDSARALVELQAVLSKSQPEKGHKRKFEDSAASLSGMLLASKSHHRRRKMQILTRK